MSLLVITLSPKTNEGGTQNDLNQRTGSMYSAPTESRSKRITP